MLHHKSIDNFRNKYNDIAYAVFRVFIGILFMFHGAQKLFGFFTDNGPQPLLSQMGVAGVIELVGGFLITIGLFTSVVAIICAIEMVGAFFIGHFTLANPIPILNRGELALVYFASFLYIAFEGGGKYSVDGWICNRCKDEHN